LARPTTSRRTFLKRLLAAAIVSGGACFWEAHRPVVEQVEVRLRRLPPAFDGFKIAQLTDIHFGEYLHEGYFNDVVARVNELRPDLVALTGDFITGPLRTRLREQVARRLAPPCAEVMSQLRAPQGVFAVLGNHDHICSPTIVAAALRAKNINVLINESRTIEHAGARIWLCGVDSWIGHNYHPKEALAKAPVEECRLVMLHEPDAADYICHYSVDFMMAGHSHGGQIRIPLLGAPVLPPKARKYPIGLRTVNGMQLYTSRGIGLIHLPFRFDCPPEITLYTLRHG
jgi:uncharacterized protein